MDLISILTSQLGIDADKAQGLAGAALGMVKDQVSEKVDAGTAERLSAAVPELNAWTSKAQQLTSGGQGGGGLLGMAAGLLGGGGAADLLQTVSKLGLDASTAQKALPLVVDFLKSRLDEQTLQKIMSAVPMLRGLGGGGLGGALGGLLG